jgi:hypothetical protein
MSVGGFLLEEMNGTNSMALEREEIAAAPSTKQQCKSRLDVR